MLGVPNLREEIFAHFHNNKEGAHSEWLRIYVKVKHFLVWEDSNEVKAWVANYDIC